MSTIYTAISFGNLNLSAPNLECMYVIIIIIIIVSCSIYVTSKVMKVFIEYNMATYGLGKQMFSKNLLNHLLKNGT